jgi:hypothetical protein
MLAGGLALGGGNGCDEIWLADAVCIWLDGGVCTEPVTSGAGA